jgi:hypothetical protein
VDGQDGSRGKEIETIRAAAVGLVPGHGRRHRIEFEKAAAFPKNE